MPTAPYVLAGGVGAALASPYAVVMPADDDPGPPAGSGMFDRLATGCRRLVIDENIPYLLGFVKLLLVTFGILALVVWLIEQPRRFRQLAPTNITP
jgi:hypothetical protein